MKIKFITVNDSRGFLITILPTNSLKIRHHRKKIRYDKIYIIIQDMERKGRLGIHYWNVAPVMGCTEQVELTLWLFHKTDTQKISHNCDFSPCGPRTSLQRIWVIRDPDPHDPDPAILYQRPYPRPYNPEIAQMLFFAIHKIFKWVMILRSSPEPYKMSIG